MAELSLSPRRPGSGMNISRQFTEAEADVDARVTQHLSQPPLDLTIGSRIGQTYKWLSEDLKQRSLMTAELNQEQELAHSQSARRELARQSVEQDADDQEALDAMRQVKTLTGQGFSRADAVSKLATAPGSRLGINKRFNELIKDDADMESKAQSADLDAFRAKTARLALDAQIEMQPYQIAESKSRVALIKLDLAHKETVAPSAIKAEIGRNQLSTDQSDRALGFSVKETIAQEAKLDSEIQSLKDDMSLAPNVRETKLAALESQKAEFDRIKENAPAKAAIDRQKMENDLLTVKHENWMLRAQSSAYEANKELFVETVDAIRNSQKGQNLTAANLPLKQQIDSANLTIGVNEAQARQKSYEALFNGFSSDPAKAAQSDEAMSRVRFGMKQGGFVEMDDPKKLVLTFGTTSPTLEMLANHRWLNDTFGDLNAKDPAEAKDAADKRAVLVANIKTITSANPDPAALTAAISAVQLVTGEYLDKTSKERAFEAQAKERAEAWTSADKQVAVVLNNVKQIGESPDMTMTQLQSIGRAFIAKNREIEGITNIYDDIQDEYLRYMQDLHNPGKLDKAGNPVKTGYNATPQAMADQVKTLINNYKTATMRRAQGITQRPKGYVTGQGETDASTAASAPVAPVESKLGPVPPGPDGKKPKLDSATAGEYQNKYGAKGRERALADGWDDEI